MFTTVRSTTMPTVSSARPAPAQTTQKKYYADGASFRVFRPPVISSLPYTPSTKLDPGYHSTRSENRHWHNPSSYRDPSGGRTPTVDDRARTPRYFSDAENNLDNRKPATDYYISSRFPLDNVIYDPLSDIYSSDYDEYFSMNTTPTSTYSLIVSEDTSLTMSDPPDLGSDYSRPTTPVETGSRITPASSVPASSPPQQHTSHSSGFRNRVDSRYSTPQANISDPDPSFRSGSNDNARFIADSRRHPVFHQTRPGNVTPAIVTNPSVPGTVGSGGGSGAGPEPPYAESVLSIESEDEVHKLAKINAGYNAAASAFYGAIGRDSQSIPSQEYGAAAVGVVPSVTRMSTPVAAAPRQPESRQMYTDAPLTSSPIQIRYADELHRSTSYRDNGSRRPPDGKDNNNAVYSSTSSHRTNVPRTAVPPPRYGDDFFPPLKEWDEIRVPPTPENSPQSPFTFQGDPSSRPRRSGERESDNAYSRPLPIPPRLYTSSEGAPHPEKVIVTHYVQRSPEGVTKREVASDDRRRERGGSVSIQVEPSRSQATTAMGTAHYSSDEYDTVGISRSTSSRRSKDGRRSTAAEDLKRTSSSSPPHDHEPRLIPKMDGSTLPTADRRQAPARRNSISVAPTTPVEESRTRSGRSSRDDPSDRDGSGRAKKSSSGYERPDRSGSSREERGAEKPKSSRHGHTHQDRVPYTSTATATATATATTTASQRQEHHSSGRGPATLATAEKPFEFERRRKDSSTQPSDIPVTVSPSLVPLARPTASQSEQMMRSYSRGAQPTTAAPITPIDPHQRPHRRHSDEHRSNSNNNSNNNNNGYTTSRRERDPAVQQQSSTIMPTSREHGPSYVPRPPEPHRRYSDGDVPQQPPFLPTDANGGGGGVGIAWSLPPQSSMYARRCVRWDDNLICPSPVLPSQRREGWFNRRGDQLWTNDGIYVPAPAGQEYPPDLDDYPEYGEGWMNEKGVRIDMGHRLIPKTPLRPALKQSQARS